MDDRAICMSIIRQGAAGRVFCLPFPLLDWELLDEKEFDRVLERPRRLSRERPRLLSPAAGVARESSWRNVQLSPFLHFIFPAYRNDKV